MTDPIVIPAALSPADADGVRNSTLKMLDAAKAGEGSLSLDIDGDALTPCAIQLVVATRRTAQQLGVVIEISECSQAALSAIQLN